MNKYSPEERERAVRIVLDGAGQHESRWAAIVWNLSKIGCAPRTLKAWVKKVEVDTSQRGGITTEQAEKLKALEREVGELKQANQILRKASAYVAPSRQIASQSPARQRSGARPPIQTMIQFIEDRRDVHRVEPICRVLPNAPATFYSNLAKRAGPTLLSDRAKRDEELKPEIERVFEATSASVASEKSGTKCAERALTSRAAQ